VLFRLHTWRSAIGPMAAKMSGKTCKRTGLKLVHIKKTVSDRLSEIYKQP